MWIHRLHVACLWRSRCPTLQGGLARRARTQACPGSGASSKPCWADAPKPAAHIHAESPAGVRQAGCAGSMQAESGIGPGLQLCRGGLPVLSPALPGLAPLPTAFPGAPWVSSFFPLLGVSGSLCIPATTHTEGHICNANVRLAQENRVHPTCPYVCRVLLAGTPLPTCTQAAGSRHPQHHRHCPQPLVSTASN